MSTGFVRRRVRRDRADWLALFEAQARSGLSQQKFCKRQGVSASAFYNAKSRYRPKALALSDSSVSEFVAVELPAQCATTGWDVELALGDDVVLRIRKS